MKEIALLRLPAIRAGHLKIVDHLMLGFACNTDESSPGIEAVPMGSWSGLKKAFCNGDLHCAFLPAPEAMELFSSGMDIRVILSCGRTGASLIGREDLSLHSIADLMDRTVLLSNYLSVYTLLLYRLISSYGLKAGLGGKSLMDLSVEAVPLFIVEDMFHDGLSSEIGGCFLEEPFASALVLHGLGRRICSSDRIWPDHPASVLAVHSHIAVDQRAALVEFINMLVSANRSVKKEMDDLHRLSSYSFLDQDERVTDAALTISLPEKPVSLVPDVKSLGIMNRFMVNEMGIMKSLIDVKALVDVSFANEAGA